ncbi:MAG: DNA primase [Proteobacteria bacterium]|nr:DNA primase [Pseudomonadota bacterium]MBU1715544.1 DNA primase [Pseudomonadota bacterium]
MTAYPQREEIVGLIKESADIAEIIGEHVNLKKNGTNLKGLCPFHSEKTPSFMVNPQRRSFHCFGCNEGGDVFNFMMKFHNLSFPETIKELARRYQITLPEKTLSGEEQARARKREALHEINQKAAEIFHDLLLHDKRAAVAREYLSARSISAEIIASFQLGFAPDSWDFLTNICTKNKSQEAAQEAGLIVKRDRGDGYYDRFRSRLVFPILGQTGKVSGFSGRIIGDGQPKYMNSPESLVFDKGKTVFGLYQNREFIRKENKCLLVEGNFDLLALMEHGIKNVCAPLGTALTPFHVRSLKGYAEEVILLFDGDSAGLKAVFRAVPLFLAEQLTAKVAVLPAQHDPDTFARKHGREGLEQLISQANSLSEFVFAQLVEKYGLTMEGKAKIVAELQAIIDALPDQQLQKTVFISHFSQKLGIPADKFQNENQPKSDVKSSHQINDKLKKKFDLPFNQRQLLEFLIIFPEYLLKFIEAGLEEVIISHSGQNILQHLKEAEEKSGGPEYLLEITEDEEKSFVSQLLISAPACTDEEKENQALEKLAWLKKNLLKVKQEKLTRQISEAQQAQDMKLCMELIEQKKSLEETLV